jgi:hypothetical protein
MPQNNFNTDFNIQGTYSNGGAPSLAVSPPVSHFRVARNYATSRDYDSLSPLLALPPLRLRVPLRERTRTTHIWPACLPIVAMAWTPSAMSAICGMHIMLLFIPFLFA